MLLKEYSITLDMLHANAFHPFELVEGDTGNVLHITLTNDGQAMDLTGCRVCAVFGSSAGIFMQDLTSGVSLGEGTGQVDVTLYPDSYGSGEVRADVQVYSGEDYATLITSRRFTFRCITALVSPDTLRASSTYPALVDAARAANEAAEAAMAAVNALDTAIGEMNVQADWSQTDAQQDDYIQNKPTIPSTAEEVGAAAAEHASRHATGGADALTPAAIGAAAAEHTHTLASLGAAPALVVKTGTLLSTGWTGTEAPYTQTVTVTGMTPDANGDIGLPDTATAEQRAAARAAMLFLTAKGADSITVSADGEAPTVDIPFELQIGG